MAKADPAILRVDLPSPVTGVKVTWVLQNGSGVERPIKRASMSCLTAGPDGTKPCEIMVKDKGKRIYVVVPLLAGIAVKGGYACAREAAGWTCLRLADEPWTQEDD